MLRSSVPGPLVIFRSVACERSEPSEHPISISNRLK